MIPNRLKPGSTNTILVENVYDTLNGVYATATTASPSAIAGDNELYDATRVTQIIPITMAYVTGTAGSWRGTLPPSLALTDGAAYYARVTIVFNSGVVRRFDIPCVAQSGN